MCVTSAYDVPLAKGTSGKSNLHGGSCSFVTTVILRYLIFPHVFWHWYRLLDRLFPGAAVKNVVRGDVRDHFHGTSSDIKSSKNVVHGDPPDPER